MMVKYQHSKSDMEWRTHIFRIDTQLWILWGLSLCCCFTVLVADTSTSAATTSEYTTENTTYLAVNETTLEPNSTALYNGSNDGENTTAIATVTDLDDSLSGATEKADDANTTLVLTTTTKPTEKKEENSDPAPTDKPKKKDNRALMGFIMGFGCFIGIGSLLCITWKVACGLGFAQKNSAKVAPADFRASAKPSNKNTEQDSTSSRRQLNPPASAGRVDFRD